ncbi:hypothetical protein [Hymenobacter coccineus]|uniref:Uncharacterized protein n=1 Tax=Hymenobacter coccineus TaxID=1908235 RepID=A0A1G1TJH0_9BACT|nr:hypothetical protein [Hymenobacter coccineus]OGX91007.1 hypothetical protein BEN49_21440 [Hymenobacter coccineus]
MPKDYDTEAEDYEATLYTDYDDAVEETEADDFEESSPVDFGDEADETDVASEESPLPGRGDDTKEVFS